MIWMFLISCAVITGLWLIDPLLKTEAGSLPQRGKISVFLISFMIAALGIYSLIGRADLTSPGALKPFEKQRVPGPSAEDIAAAKDLSPESLSEMINGMVNQLAGKLAQTPDDPQGWAHLLRSRTVLGQEQKKAQDIETIKSIYQDRPEIAAQILDEAVPK